MKKNRSSTTLAAISLALLAAGVSMPSAEAQDIKAQSPSEREFNPRVLMKHFRPIVDAPNILANKVEDQVADNELVLGVVVAGEARAYPINMLTGPKREIINDQLGGQAIAATW